MDSNGDGIGDIPGITNRLEYLKELKVDAVFLSSIFKSPLRDFGYDVSDYYSIHPDYGTMDEFENLLRKARELNIKVLLDFIPNHTSNESEWFVKSANKDEYYSDWYIWETGHMDNHGLRSPPNNWV
ncbi:hypothetical protein MSG28_002486 [Choristoneura fumiferana]|uniref:Uncharacterized protein n=1 Tax=Choristoneura fumiferana TaxID=7141 RepID=A0ACC0JVR6_CHOFU|nr:hypothetical protein MSG28_002486 [Choristoneura fumiferana]